MFSGCADQYRSIEIAQIKLYFSGYTECRSIGQSEKPSSNLILVDMRSTRVLKEIRLDLTLFTNGKASN